MPRNMSFLLTTEQIRTRTKTVTRRLGWATLRAGDRLTACVRCMGLRRGERIERLAELVVVSVRREPLSAIDDADVVREGFVGRDAAWFVGMFCEEMGVGPATTVTRIEFAYL